MVGAVVVHQGRIVGRGYHRRAGGPHAEVEALGQAGPRARGSTLYVSLEPCAHTGRTGPCTQAILQAGVRRVVAAMRDPDPRNRGRGLRLLRAQGVQTRVGVLESEARALNQLFVTRVTQRRPFVTVKVAQSLDGKIATATGASRWISGPQARAWGHRLRSRSDAILVGVGTVLKDDPRLTTRGKKIILDSGLRTPADARIFKSGGAVVIATTSAAPRSKEQRLRRSGATVIRFAPQGRGVPVKPLLRWLARRGVNRLLIEGGGEVIGSAFSARVVDRVAWVIAPKILGGRTAPSSVAGEGVNALQGAIRITRVKMRRLGKDLLLTGEVRTP